MSDATIARAQAAASAAASPVVCAPGAAAAPETTAVTLTIDGVPVTVKAGTTILGAARKAGVRIPTLCYLRNVNAIGSCRICVVEAQGRAELITACNTPVEDGMEVLTNTDRVMSARRASMGLILSEHGLNSTNFCFSCVRNGSCELQDTARELGVTEPLFPAEPKRKPVLDDNPFLKFDPNLCIRCQRCVGACNNLARNHTLTTGKKGTRTVILAPFGPNWKETSCESCGCCAAACPTGALTLKRRETYRAWEVERTLTTCPHCAIGCQYNLVTKDGRIVDTEVANGPSNGGRLCVKGRSASFDFVQAPDRLSTPLIKNRETGEFEPASWDEALDLVATKFTEIKQRHGGDALAAFACSRSTNEDVYLLQKMARCAFETNNVDNCARV